MKRIDKASVSAWVLLSVFLPMVLLASLHVHPEFMQGSMPCHECIDHTVHNGHVTAIKASVDCPLCAFQSNVYQGEQEAMPSFIQQATPVERACTVPMTVAGTTPHRQSRAPPFSYCA